MLRRMLLIGDVHAEDERLAAVLAHGAGQVDAVLSVGDIVDGVDGAGEVRRCMELLVAHHALVVRGNHDRWAVAGQRFDPRGYPAEVVAWLATLPATRELPTVAGLLLLGHGVGADDMVRLQPFDEGYAVASNTALQQLIAAGRHRWFVGGHTHRRMVRRFGGLTVINPGTLRRDKDPCCAIVDLDDHVVQFFDASLVEDAPLRLLETVSLANVGPAW